MDRRVTQTRFVKTDLPKPKRVAVYARISSDKDAMLHSLSAQISYYSQMIKNHSGWEYVGIYADEALTGTKDNRENFQRLLLDCKNNKVDMIITKSISRFARNTLTLLETVRELKSLGIDVYFEEQNIHTQSPDGELMLTILAGYAQEESLSASENQKWKIRQNFQNGKITNVRRFFGYKIVDGELVVDPITASVVKEIFKRAVDGESFGSIALNLNERGINGTNGGRWKTGHIADLLGNEKYKGSALLQKKYRNNHLEKREVRNRGELPMYYVKDSLRVLLTKRCLMQFLKF
ncbi:MAG: recombinase family protein [Oscillospiraceae bacterium]|nr:recombinase family protein [Oscillospiraceae bacterium]